ncbi:MAG: hypothetical protein QW417_04695 [Zestosphaera sp.]
MSSSNELIAKTTSFFRTKEKLEGWVVVFFLVFLGFVKIVNVVVSGFPRLTAVRGEGLEDALMKHPKETNKNLKIRSGLST